jgi:hypothetical protein
MSKVVDLGSLKKKPSHQKKDVSYDDLSPEDQAKIDALAEEKADPEPEGIPVLTAFIVAIGKDGGYTVIPDLSVALLRDRIPTADDIYAACQVVSKDIQTSETAVSTAQFMQQMAQAQMQQRESQKLAQGLKLPR